MDFFGASQHTKNPKKRTSVLWCVCMHGNNYLATKTHLSSPPITSDTSDIMIKAISQQTTIFSTNRSTQCYRAPIVNAIDRRRHGACVWCMRFEACPTSIRFHISFRKTSCGFGIYFRKTIWIKFHQPVQREYAEPQLDKIAEATHQPPPSTNSFQRQESLANKSSESKGIKLIHTESEERKISEHYSIKYVPRLHIFLSYI